MALAEFSFSQATSEAIARSRLWPPSSHCGNAIARETASAQAVNHEEVCLVSDNVQRFLPMTGVKLHGIGHRPSRDGGGLRVCIHRVFGGGGSAS
jgi:hypothetical protein